MVQNNIDLEIKIVEMIKTVYDPDISVNVYDLGLIYGIDVDDEKNVKITMTLTSPSCPMADFIIEDINMKVESIAEINKVEVEVVFEPEWSRDMITEEGLLELGLL